jgi:hypothetical protein
MDRQMSFSRHTRRTISLTCDNPKNWNVSSEWRPAVLCVQYGVQYLCTGDWGDQSNCIPSVPVVCLRCGFTSTRKQQSYVILLKSL